MIRLTLKIHDDKSYCERTLSMRALESLPRLSKASTLLGELNMLMAQFQSGNTTRYAGKFLDTDAVGTCGCKATVSTVKS